MQCAFVVIIMRFRAFHKVFNFICFASAVFIFLFRPCVCVCVYFYSCGKHTYKLFNTSYKFKLRRSTRCIHAIKMLIHLDAVDISTALQNIVFIENEFRGQRLKCLVVTQFENPFSALTRFVRCVVTISVLLFPRVGMY